MEDNCMLVKWSISSWGATKRDQKETEETCKNKGTTKEWLRVNKSLLPEDALKPIRQVEREARAYHYKMTLPFDDDGWRILPAAVLEVYEKEFNRLKDRDWELVEALCGDLPRLKEEAKKNLNGSYCEEDYPTGEELWDCFDMTMTVRPVPRGSALQVDINGGALKRLQESIDATAKRQIQESVMDLWYRMRNVVGAMADRLSDDDAKFRDSLVTNITDVLDILPKLNITGDNDLSVMAQRVKEQLTAYSPDTLRGKRDKSVRTTTATKAKEIVTQIDRVINDRARKFDLDLE